MRKFYVLLIAVTFATFYNNSFGQCFTAGNGQYPAATFTPACTGAPETITTVAFAGEYSVVAVTLGNGYVFSSSLATDYLTISDAAGTIAYAFGTTPVSWTATFTGTVRFYTHTNAACGENTTSRSRIVQCIPPPCATPTNQPTGLTLNATHVVISGSFTAAAGAPDGYLVVRYPAGSVTTAPTNATAYSPGNALGLGTVVTSGAATTFNATGLTPGTNYDFYIYSFKTTPSCLGPVYRVTSPLTSALATFPLSPFSGAFTINPDAPISATNFQTWTDAITSLNTVGVVGATTITVTGLGSTITFNEGNLLLGGAYISGIPQSALLATLSATNTLTFVAGPGKTINMSGTGVSTTIDYVFRLMGVDYVTFDGINIVDVGATVTTQFEFGYVIGNASNADGATNNTIKNFNITLFKTNTGQANGPYGVMVQNGIALVSALGLTGTNASRNNNIKIQNFNINGAKRGISFSGLAIPAYDEGSEISGPSFTSAAGGVWTGGSRITNGGGATANTDWGISIDGQKNMKVFNVQIDNFVEASATPALSGIHFGTAVSTATGSDNVEVYNCVIHDLQNNLATTASVNGIRAAGTTLHTLKLYNNAIYDLRATAATGTSVIAGMVLSATGAGSKFDLYNNSINLPGALAAAGVSKGFVFSLAGAVINAKNNIISFGTTGGGSTGGVIAIDFGATAPTLINFSNNLYYVGTPSASRRVAVYNSNNRPLLIDWQSTMATPSDGVDQGAGYGDPGFASATNLLYGANNSSENSGVGITGLSTNADILGVARSATTPDLGAFEGNFSSGFIDVASAGISITPLEGSVASDVRVVITDNVNAASNITARLWYRLGAAGAFTALAPDVIPGSGNNGVYRWGASLRALPAGLYQYYIVARDAAGNSFAVPTMTPGAAFPGFTTSPTDPNWSGANPFASAGVRTFQNSGSVLAGGTYTVGTGESYTTLTAVANEISTKPLSGNVIFELTNNYTGAGETFPIVFNQPSYTVAGPITITIRPAASVITERVTAGDPGASNSLIVFDGVRDLTIDGRPGGAGTNRMWRFTNTRDNATTTGETFRFQNDALRNTLKYLTIQANTNTGLLGVINIGSTFYGGKGNSFNTIDNNDIGPNAAGVLATNPTRGIGAVGGGTNSYNTNNTYSNNNIHDFHNIALNPVGIFVAGEVGVTITGNSFYQTTPKSGWAAFGLGIAINGATGPGATVTNNYIGGSAPLCGGAPMTISATTTVFYGIQINVGQYTSGTTVSGNTITNMALSTANATSNSVVACGINPATGTNQMPFTISNNTIGNSTVDALTSPAITLTSTGTGAPSIFSGIFASVSGVSTITNNTIGGVKLLNTAAGTSSFIGIQQQTNGVATNIDNNVIGSLATANNIVQSTNATITGIAQVSLALSNTSISNNTVANVLFNAAASGSSQTFLGISASGSAPLTINSNTIRDVTGNNHATVTGISMTSSGTGTIISNNNIRNFTINPQTPTTSITVQGIQISSSTSTGSVYNNVVHSLINGSTSTTALLRGMQNNFGTAWTYSNNMISLGAGVTGPIIIRGMEDFSDATATGFGNFYYNTVYISGTASGATNTYAFYRATSSTPQTFRNNIFANARTGGTGFHVAMANSSSATGWPANASDYNDLYSSSPATVAQWLGTGAVNNRDLAGWQASQAAGTPGSGGDANSLSVLPVFISGTDLHLSAAAGSNWCLNGSGIVVAGFPVDIDAQVRSVGVRPNGPDMGADEFVATSSTNATPASQTVCSGNPITTIVIAGSGTTYNWTRDNTVTVTGIAASGSGDISGTLTNTTTSPITVTFTITPVINGCNGPNSITATVLVNPTPDAIATPSSQTICSGATITTIVLTGGVSGTTFNWTRDNTGTVTGIAANGAGDISGSLTNTTNAPITVTFTITPTANGCPGTPITATVVVNPIPDAIAAPPSQTICSGDAITTITISGAVGGTTFNWTRDNTGTVTGIGANGSGNISGTLTNTTGSPVTVTFTITPTANGCPGTPITATVVVNPQPIVNGSITQPTTCVSADGAIDVTVSNSAGPFNYFWSTIGGSGIVQGVEDQTGLTVGQYTVVVTDQNTGCQQTAVFNLPGPGGCSLCPVISAISTNPTPAVCANDNVTLDATGLAFMGVTYGITFKYSSTPLPDPYVGGTFIGTVPNGGLGNSGTTATFNTFFAVPGNYYVYAILSPTPFDPFCRPSQVVSLTVNPVPTVDPVANATFCNGTNVPTGTFNFTSPTTGGGNGKVLIPYADSSGPPTLLQTALLGMPGITQVDLFDALNGTPSLALMQQYSIVVPFSNSTYNDPVTLGNNLADYVDAGGVVVGLGFTFYASPYSPTGRWVTGNYSPYNTSTNLLFTPHSLGTYNAGHPLMAGVSAMTSNFQNVVTVAAGATEVAQWDNGNSLVAFKGRVVGITAYIGVVATWSGDFAKVIVNAGNWLNGAGNITFNWTNSNTAIGLAASGSGTSLPTFTATNAGTAPISGTISVTATYSFGGANCTGPATNFIITVNPTPTVNAVADQTVCNGAATAAVNFSGAVPGTVYSWTNNNTTIGLAASGTGNIASFNAINTGTTPQVATITVTPTYTNGVACSGTPVTFTITVNPTPNVNAVANQTYCPGTVVPSIVFSGGVPGTVYTWSRTVPVPDIGVLPTNGVGSVPSFTATNPGAGAPVSTFTVTPTYTNNGVTCTGAPITFTITIYPTPVINPVPNVTVCHNQLTAPIIFSSPMGGVTYNWSNNNTTIGLGASGTGNIPSFLANNPGVAPVVATITVTPITSGAAVQTFNYTGAVQTWTVPPGVTSIDIQTWGGQGNNNGQATVRGGLGGFASGTLAVTPGETLWIYVGGGGTTTTTGGFNGGGAGGTTTTCTLAVGGGGGGASDVRQGANTLAGRKIVAGGGGGSPGNRVAACSRGAGGGGGGGYYGGGGGSGYPGATGVVPTGGTQIAGGSGGITGTAFGATNGLPGVLGIGGAGGGEVASNQAASLVAGFFGGAGGGATGAAGQQSGANDFTGQSGAGGSSYIGGVTAGITTANQRSGNGMVTISYNAGPPPVVCSGTPTTFTITVNPAPRITCPPNQTVNAQAGLCGAIVNYPPAVGFGPPAPVITYNFPPGSFFPVGTTTVIATATNTCGTATCSFTVTVVDNIPPTIVCPANITVNNTAGQCGANVTYQLPTISDNCPLTGGTPVVLNQSSDPTTITPIQIGCQYVGGITAENSWWRAYDMSAYNLPAGVAIKSVRFGIEKITGTTVPITARLYRQTSGTFPAGTRTLIATQTQNFGVQTGTFGTIVFTTPPSATPSDIIIVELYCPDQLATGAGFFIGSNAAAETGDSYLSAVACGAVTPTNLADLGFPDDNIHLALNAEYYTAPPTLVQIAGLPSGAFFPVGTTTNTYRATDANGNQSTCSFTVTVNDAQAPAITCPNNIVRNTDPGVCTATIAVPNPTFSDNCGVTRLTWVMSGATSGSSPATGINFVGTQTFNLNGTTGQGVTTITYTARDNAGNITTCSFTVTVNDARIPVISGQPTTRFYCVGTNAVFTVAATAGGGGILNYQWQAWDGSTWVNIAGATTSTLTIPNITFADNTKAFRVILTGSCSVVTSSAAVLYVNPLPTVTLLTSIPPVLSPGQSLNITSTVNPPGGAYAWFFNGVLSPTHTTGVWTGITVDGIGTYRLVYTDPNGCTNASADVVVSGQPSGNLWVYPNPNTGQFQVRFFNAPGEQVTINVFDAKGALVYKQALTTGTPYTGINIDLGVHIASGVYIVEAHNASGQSVGARRIIIRHP